MARTHAPITAAVTVEIVTFAESHPEITIGFQQIGSN